MKRPRYYWGLSALLIALLLAVPAFAQTAALAAPAAAAAPPKIDTAIPLGC
jgi:hypothetical protein